MLRKLQIAKGMVDLILILFFCYFLLMLFLIEGWRKALHRKTQSLTSAERMPLISVIVPVRNELEKIVNLLQNIASQNYPAEKYEAFIVNDHSDDGTREVVENWLAENPSSKFSFINLSGPLTGKKTAITEGIVWARGEIIVTTDADCSFGPGWLTSVASAFDKEIQMVCGPVRIVPDKTIFGSLQSMEFASLVGTGAATLAWRVPTMCNGANLAFRKSIFQEVGGYMGNINIASGDDEFLLRKVFNQNPGGVRFMANPDALVSVNPMPDFAQFFQQRIRWAAKWRKHGFGWSSWLAVFIFLFHLGVVAIPILVLTESISVQDAFLLIGSKLVFEAVFLYRVLKFLELPFNVLSFLALQVVYPLYVMFFAVSANFFQGRWKGRKI